MNVWENSVVRRLRRLPHKFFKKPSPECEFSSRREPIEKLNKSHYEVTIEISLENSFGKPGRDDELEFLNRAKELLVRKVDSVYLLEKWLEGQLAGIRLSVTDMRLREDHKRTFE